MASRTIPRLRQPSSFGPGRMQDQLPAASTFGAHRIACACGTMRFSNYCWSELLRGIAFQLSGWKHSDVIRALFTGKLSALLARICATLEFPGCSRKTTPGRPGRSRQRRRDLCQYRCSFTFSGGCFSCGRPCRSPCLCCDRSSRVFPDTMQDTDKKRPGTFAGSFQFIE